MAQAKLMRILLLVAACLVGGVRAIYAQFTETISRLYRPEIAALAMGEAVAAVPLPQTAFFYNPAHLIHVTGLKPSIVLIGVQGALSTNVFDQVAFVQDELRPAIDEGLENLTPEERRRLYEETLEKGRTRTTAALSLQLPTVSGRIGPVAAGGGVFLSSAGRYRTVESSSGVGIPRVEADGRLDVLAVGTASVQVQPGWSLGLSLKYLRRYLTHKHKSVEAFAPSEALLLLRGQAIGADVGVLYEPPLPGPGQLRLGLVLYNLVYTPLRYRYSRTLSGNDGASQSALLAEEIVQANQYFGMRPGYRIGVAYTWRWQTPGGWLQAPTVSLDYIHQRDMRGGVLTRLSLGTRIAVGPVLSVAAGLHQGYTTAGLGLRLGGFRLAYALFGFEEGRLPGQLPSWQHTASLTISL
ncbi:hypothetical protein RHBI111906_04910 [Rhodothermus bifroesti]|nr:hypothetical protein HRbin18_01677 [bacterium HR18]